MLILEPFWKFLKISGLFGFFPCKASEDSLMITSPCKNYVLFILFTSLNHVLNLAIFQALQAYHGIPGFNFDMYFKSLRSIDNGVTDSLTYQVICCLVVIQSLALCILNIKMGPFLVQIQDILKPHIRAYFF